MRKTIVTLLVSVMIVSLSVVQTVMANDEETLFNDEIVQEKITENAVVLDDQTDENVENHKLVDEEDAIQLDSINEKEQHEEITQRIDSTMSSKAPVSWDNLQTLINEADDGDIIDFSKIAAKTDVKEIFVDGKTLTLENLDTTDLKINLSNSANITLKNISINNNEISAIESLDMSNNQVFITETVNLNVSNGASGISVSNTSKLTIRGDGKLIISSVDGAGIGGEKNHASGDITIEGSPEVFITSTGLGAGIGGGLLPGNEDNNIITIKENASVSINNTGSGGAGIGGGHNLGAVSPGTSSGDIIIAGNAVVDVKVSTETENAAGIGTAEGGRLGRIYIRDSAKVSSLVAINYDPVSESFSENPTYSYAGTAIGNAYGYIGVHNKAHGEQFFGESDAGIYISGNPKVVAGSDNGGISVLHGTIDISGGNINAASVTNVPAIGSAASKDNRASEARPLDVVHINISGKDTLVKADTRTLMSDSDYDSKSAFIPAAIGSTSFSTTGLTRAESKTFINIKEATIIANSYSGSAIGLGSSASFAEMYININSANITAESFGGAGIGSGVDSFNSSTEITIDGAIVNSVSTHGAGVGSGASTSGNSTTAIDIKNTEVNASSWLGAGIGMGTGSGKESLDRELGSILIENSKVITHSDYGSGIGLPYQFRTLKPVPIVINGGNIYTTSLYASGIGGDGVYVEGKGDDGVFHKGTEIANGSLIVKGDAKILAFSGTKKAISSKLKDGSDYIMMNQTLSSKTENPMNIRSISHDSLATDEINFTIPKGYISYAYTTNNNGSDFYEIDTTDSDNLRNIIQRMEFRETGRHPEGYKLFTPVNIYTVDYKTNAGSEYLHEVRGGSDVLKDYTYVGFGYSVQYLPNGGHKGSVPLDPIEYPSGTVAIIRDNEGSLIRDGYEFVNWNTEADGSGQSYNGEDKVVMEKSIVLYAQWKKIEEPEKPINPIDPIDPEKPVKPVEPTSPILPSTGLSNNYIGFITFGLGILLINYNIVYRKIRKISKNNV